MARAAGRARRSARSATACAWRRAWARPRASRWSPRACSPACSRATPRSRASGCVIFDEFHERSLHADLGLALALESQAVLRADLRLLVMSATLDGDAGRARCWAMRRSSPARAAPSGRDALRSTRRPEGRLEAAVAARRAARAGRRRAATCSSSCPARARSGAWRSCLAEPRLPAARDGRCRSTAASRGGAGPRRSRRARRGRRKVVLATAIAETSLTIEGVRVVVDCGLIARATLLAAHRDDAAGDGARSRAPRPSSGAGGRDASRRACATGSGRSAEQAALLPHGTRPRSSRPISRRWRWSWRAWGVADPDELRWLDPPPAAAFAPGARAAARARRARRGRARSRRTAGAWRRSRCTRGSRTCCCAARTLGHGALACDLAALLAERDLLRGADAAAGRGRGAAAGGAACRAGRHPLCAASG